MCFITLMIQVCDYPSMIATCVLFICLTVILCFVLRFLQGYLVKNKKNKCPQISEEALNQIKSELSKSIADVGKTVTKNNIDKILSLLPYLKDLTMDEKKLQTFFQLLASYANEKQPNTQEASKEEPKNGQSTSGQS